MVAQAAAAWPAPAGQRRGGLGSDSRRRPVRRGADSRGWRRGLLTRKASPRRRASVGGAHRRRAGGGVDGAG
jgi:hypothetical protein